MFARLFDLFLAACTVVLGFMLVHVSAAAGAMALGLLTGGVLVGVSGAFIFASVVRQIADAFGFGAGSQALPSPRTD